MRKILIQINTHKCKIREIVGENNTVEIKLKIKIN